MTDRLFALVVLSTYSHQESIHVTMSAVQSLMAGSPTIHP